MNRRYAPLIALAAITAAAGCGSLGGSPSGAPSAAPSSAPSAAAAASSAPCTTKACIAGDLQQNLTGLVAQDEAVSTKVKCYKRTVRFHQAADTYSATCVVTYSDGSSVTGTGNLLLSAKKVTFEPAG